jgi:hypothetical protein
VAFTNELAQKHCSIKAGPCSFVEHTGHPA